MSSLCRRSTFAAGAFWVAMALPLGCASSGGSSIWSLHSSAKAMHPISIVRGDLVRDPTAHAGGVHGALCTPTLTSLSPSRVSATGAGSGTGGWVTPQPAGAAAGHGETGPRGDDPCRVQRKETAGEPWREGTSTPARGGPHGQRDSEAQAMSSVCVV